MSYNIKWEDNGVFVELQGKVDSTELSHLNNRLYADERYDKIDFQVLDMTSADVELSKNEIIEIGSLDFAAAKWNNNLRLALLANNQALIDLFEKHYAKNLETTDREISAFSSRKEALKWIKL